MAKGKYEYWLTPEGLLLLEGYARDGLTEEQIAQSIGVRRSTLSAWKVKYSDISDAIKKGKDVVDRQVENALFKRTQGHKEQVLKAFKVKRVEYENGRRVLEVEEVVQAVDEVYVPPDTTAQIFWLCNRKPGVWAKNPQPEEGAGGSSGFADLLAAAYAERMKKK